MKAKRITYTIILIIMISVTRSYGQTDSARIKAETMLGQHLKTDTSTAGKVLNIQTTYKKAVKQILVNASMTDQQRRAAIDSLIDVKNQQLEQILTLHQRDLVVPSSERRRNWKPDTTSNKTH